MLNKPADFDTTAAYGDGAKIAPGGHICKIMGVEVRTSQNGNEMLAISLDTANDDSQPAFFAAKYRANTAADKKWPCVMFQLVSDNQGATHRGFKTFITSVEESNNGFSVVWGQGFEACFKGKMVGCIFREEEFMGERGPAMSVKPFAFRSVQAIRDGVEVPAPKKLNSAPTAPIGSRPPSSYGGGSYTGAPVSTAPYNPYAGDPFANSASHSSSVPAAAPAPVKFEGLSPDEDFPF